MDGEFKHQGYSNLIDVTKIFNNLKYSDYVIIKDDGNFPNYFDGDDLIHFWWENYNDQGDMITIKGIDNNHWTRFIDKNKIEKIIIN